MPNVKIFINRWCGECKELVVRENAVHTRSVFTSFFRSWRKVDPSWIPSDPDLSLVPADPGFGQKLQKLNFLIGPNGTINLFSSKIRERQSTIIYFVLETLKWLVPFYTNLHTSTFEPSQGKMPYSKTIVQYSVL